MYGTPVDYILRYFGLAFSLEFNWQQMINYNGKQ
jgi:hypothetical protein